MTFEGCPNSNGENGQEQEILRETPLVTVAEFIQDFRATINLEEESEYVKSYKNLLCHWKKKFINAKVIFRITTYLRIEILKDKRKIYQLTYDIQSSKKISSCIFFVRNT